MSKLPKITCVKSWRIFGLFSNYFIHLPTKYGGDKVWWALASDRSLVQCIYNHTLISYLSEAPATCLNIENISLAFELFTLIWILSFLSEKKKPNYQKQSYYIKDKWFSRKYLMLLMEEYNPVLALWKAMGITPTSFQKVNYTLFLLVTETTSMGVCDLQTFNWRRKSLGCIPKKTSILGEPTATLLLVTNWTSEFLYCNCGTSLNMKFLHGEMSFLIQL
jgi:hypothetical protein